MSSPHLDGVTKSLPKDAQDEGHIIHRSDDEETTTSPELNFDLLKKDQRIRELEHQLHESDVFMSNLIMHLEHLKDRLEIQLQTSKHLQMELEEQQREKDQLEQQLLETTKELHQTQTQQRQLEQKLFQTTNRLEQKRSQCDIFEKRLQMQNIIAQENERELERTKAALEQTRHELGAVLRQRERNRAVFRDVVQNHCAVVPLPVTYAEAFAGTTKQVVIRGDAVAVTIPPGVRSHDALVADVPTTTTRGRVFVVLLARCAHFKRVGDTLYALRRANGSFPHPNGQTYGRHATAPGFGPSGQCIPLDADAFSAVVSEDDAMATPPEPPGARREEVLTALRDEVLQRLSVDPSDPPGDPFDALLALFRR